MIDILGEMCQKLGKSEDFKALSGVFTHVPSETPYPYMTLEKTKSEESFSSHRSNVVLKVWSRYRGDAEVSLYEKKLKETLEMAEWISGACLKIEASQVKILNDGLTRVLEMRLEIWIRGI
ncbi:DUF3168 domain-containing protein [Candidatus Bealeia paramacronuclearis]|uniref:DUF3168 domain-containing protein n=1 Tax=Candidatus Bealeia paramacronuclearis TaxID=1921001 RepID=A0ABZ2C469_9PROT|nr:hypothetical protein [Candidatus Bealeia paramacronuclearis]